MNMTVEVTCTVCGKQFETSWERRKQSRYCSSSCKYRAAKLREMYKKNKFEDHAFEGVDTKHYADIQKAKTLALLGPIGKDIKK